MELGTKTLRLTGNQLKLIALIAMTVDHLGLFIFHDMIIMRMIGRLAMPIFAWMIAEGCYYTKNRLKYFLTMAGFGTLCQVVYLVAMESLTQCILITFSLSVVLIYALDYATKKRNLWSLSLMGVAFAAVAYICVFLPGDLPGTDFSVDYGIYGVFLPVLIYIGKTKEQKLMAAAIGMLPLALRMGWWQFPCFLALPLLALYDGKRGKRKLKYLFYIYYPLHLVAIYGISMLLTLN